MEKLPNDILRDLQSLINLLGAHPELPRPTSININIYDFEKEDLEEAQMVAKALGSFEKDIDDSFFRLIKTFGRVELSYIFFRDAVCTKTVVGIKKETKLVPHPDALMIEREVETDIIEWDCPSLLEGDQKDA